MLVNVSSKREAFAKVAVDVKFGPLTPTSCTMNFPSGFVLFTTDDVSKNGWSLVRVALHTSALVSVKQVNTAGSWESGQTGSVRG